MVLSTMDILYRDKRQKNMVSVLPEETRSATCTVQSLTAVTGKDELLRMLAAANLSSSENVSELTATPINFCNAADATSSFWFLWWAHVAWFSLAFYPQEMLNLKDKHKIELYQMRFFEREKMPQIQNSFKRKLIQ